MEIIRPVKTDEYQVKYWILEFDCPKCGADNELHLQEDALFIEKIVTCYKCKHEYKVEYN